MLGGWRNQQLARRLAFSTVEGRERAVRAFATHAGAFPWEWTPTLVDEWMTDLRAVRRLRRSTLRGYQIAVRLFCGYITDPVYGWSAECEKWFGTHPVQVVHEWNAAVHVQEAEADPSKRASPGTNCRRSSTGPTTKSVLSAQLGARGGWRRSGTRRCSSSPTGMACGATRCGCSTWPTSAPTSHAPEFGELGVCYVRHGKAMKGSPPKRRSVLTVWPWVAEVARGVDR